MGSTGLIAPVEFVEGRWIYPHLNMAIFIGAWNIYPIRDGNQFSRCAADLNGPAGVLRFGYFPNGKYCVSWPSANGGITQPAPATL